MRNNDDDANYYKNVGKYSFEGTGNLHSPFLYERFEGEYEDVPIFEDRDIIEFMPVYENVKDEHFYGFRGTLGNDFGAFNWAYNSYRNTEGQTLSDNATYTLTGSTSFINSGRSALLGLGVNASQIQDNPSSGDGILEIISPTTNSVQTGTEKVTKTVREQTGTERKLKTK